MSLLVVGLNHRTAPADLLEAAAVPGDEHAKVLAGLLALDPVLEAAVLSTCNRVEVYAHVNRFHAGLEDLIAWFSDRVGTDVEAIAASAYSHFDEGAAAHLFSVAAGLDSVIVGERQIALQVRDAANSARDAGASRRVLQRLFNQSLSVARRVRSETEIASGASSMVDVGLDAALADLTTFAGRTVLIVGAGKIGGLAADRIRRIGAERIFVHNRSAERAEGLAARVGGASVTRDDLEPIIGEADLVVCCAGAATILIDADLVAGRAGAPLVILDLAMPRNVAPEVAALPGVRLIDIEEVREAADASGQDVVTDEARAIVEEETARFRSWTQAVKIEPTIKALRARAEQIRQDELERLAARLSSLDPVERETVEALTRGVLNTLLHEPSVRLKELADTGGAENHAHALRDLFDLDE